MLGAPPHSLFLSLQGSRGAKGYKVSVGVGMRLLPQGVPSDLCEPLLGLCTLQGEKGKRGIDGVDGMKVSQRGGRAGDLVAARRAGDISCPAPGPVDPKPPGRVQTTILVGLSWEGVDEPERES